MPRSHRFGDSPDTRGGDGSAGRGRRDDARRDDARRDDGRRPPDAEGFGDPVTRRTPLKIGGMIVCGEIDNTRPYNVCGWLKLRGQEHPLTLNLTGDAGEGLRGMRVRFDAGGGSVQQFVPPPLSEILAWQQVGPTGPMTLTEEPGGTGSLRLEWDSQNGRVRADLRGVDVLVVPEDEEDDDVPFDALAASDDEDDDEPLPWMDDDDEDGGVFLGAGAGGGGAFFDDEDDDPFGLFSADLQDRLDDEADDLDRQVIPGYDGGDYDGPFSDADYAGGDRDEDAGDFVSDLRRLEELIESGAGVPIAQVFDPPLKLRPASALSDAQAETALKLLLARLAEHGIAIDVCEHFPPRRVYDYLLREICPAELTHPELDPIRWVQHFSTSDACEHCEAEFEREFEEYERNRRDRDEDGDDVPW